MLFRGGCSGPMRRGLIGQKPHWQEPPIVGFNLIRLIASTSAARLVNKPREPLQVNYIVRLFL
jgi:hypothetical protein